jgi:hypothetical protein
VHWYADNSDLNGVRGAVIPDIVLFGGVAVPTDGIAALQAAIEAVKARYGDPRVPVKWNFRDLEGLYARHDLKNLYAKLAESSRQWRQEIFEAAARLDFSIIISCVESYSVTREDIKVVKPGLIGIAFGNGLMRFALHAKEFNAKTATVVLDWPERGDSRPFDREYVAAYVHGTSTDRDVKYHSGPLKQINFSDSVTYAHMRHSTILQFADLIVGATREFVECAMGKRVDAFGLQLLRIVGKKFRGAPDHILGRGVIVSSGNDRLSKSVGDAISRELAPHAVP